MSIEVSHVSKSFGRFKALNDVSLSVPDGELVALLGPSGSGKTTLLRIIAGLEKPDPPSKEVNAHFTGEGHILFHGQNVADRHASQRQVGFVFQHYALFRHMSVFENIAFGLRVRPRKLRPSREEIEQKVRDLLRLIQLENLSDRYPSQLSGGQRQRVALARALAVEPRVLLLDEPFGALDARVRQELRRWLRRLHDEIHVTSLFVTHDQEEALEVSDRVVIMNEGRIEQVGTPEEVYHHPATSFVYGFLGDINLFHGRIDNGRARIVAPGEAGDGGAILTPVYVRPHLLDIEQESSDPTAMRARVTHLNPAGPFVKVELISEWGAAIQASLTQERYRELGLKRDMDVYVVPKELRTMNDR